MVILKPAVAVCGVGTVESITCTVKLEVPAVVGIPDITAPVKESPAGKQAVPTHPPPPVVISQV
jgi:hypothetical protein